MKNLTTITRTCRGQVSLPQNTITALEALARTKAARRELVTYDPGLAPIPFS